MGYLVIENFAGGVDRTRPIYASNAGTLWAGINGHMTRGGDFEKRKAFVKFYSIPQDTVQSVYLTEISVPSAVKFIPKFIGSAADANGVVLFYNTAPTFPPININVRNVIIAHPFTGGNYIPILATKLLSYDIYGGKIYCIVQFDDGSIFPYYDGVVVSDFSLGLDYIGAYIGDGSAADIGDFGRSLQAAINAETGVSAKTITYVGSYADGYTLKISGFTTGELSYVTRTLADGSGKVTYNVTAGTPAFINFNVQNDTSVYGTPLRTYRYNIEFAVTGGSVNVGLDAKPTACGTYAKTYKRKVYLVNKSLLDFSGVDKPTKYDRDDDAGAGFINMSTQTSGSENITALQSYQDKLAIFSRKNIQIWFMADDPANNASSQIISNTGTRSPLSVAGFGDIDVFYLAETGVRSIRARDSTNSASINDVGTPIDTLLQGFFKELTSAQIEAAASIVDPIDGRYLLALGNRVIVFSYFPSKKISAWSWYEVGFQIDKFLNVNETIYAVSGYSIYRIGGANNSTYGNDYEVTAQLPFITGGKTATYKQIKGVDIAAEGTWDFSFLTNPRNLAEKVNCGELDGFTYQQDNIAALGHFTHIAPLLKHMGAGYASISSVAVHFDGAEEE